MALAVDTWTHSLSPCATDREEVKLSLRRMEGVGEGVLRFWFVFYPNPTLI